MKRLFLLLSLFLFAYSTVSAQDLESATNIYNEGAVALQSGDKAEALKKFEDALAQTETIGPDAEELANNCKNAIPAVILSIGKDQAAANDLDNALLTINKAIEKAKEYGKEDITDEATALIPKLYLAEGNAKLKAKDYAGAVAMYKKVVELEPTNGNAYLLMGQASSRTTDEATTVDALEKAVANGQEAKAKSALAKYYYNMAASALKAKNNDQAYSYGQKTIATLDGPEAVKAMSISGKAAMAMKKYADAIENFESYLAKSPNAKDANSTMYQLATAYEATGNKAKACGYYKQIIADPNFKEFATHKVNVELKCN